MFRGETETPEGVTESVRRITHDDTAGRWLTLNLQPDFKEATKGMAEGANPYGAAHWTRSFYGRKGDILETYFRALPNGDDRWRDFHGFLQVMRAHARRIPVRGDEFEPKKPSRGLGDQSGLIARMFTRMQVWREDFRLGVNTRELARIVTDPTLGPRLEALAKTYSPEEENAPGDGVTGSREVSKGDPKAAPNT